MRPYLLSVIFIIIITKVVPRTKIRATMSSVGQKLLIIQFTIWAAIMPDEVSLEDLAISNQLLSRVVIEAEILNHVKMNQNLENMSLLDSSWSGKMHLGITEAVHFISCE
jgi:hypothetical protein